MSIMERGGGIVSTVAATRNSNFIQLRGKAEGFLKQMSVMGVTTVEGKAVTAWTRRPSCCNSASCAA